MKNTLAMGCLDGLWILNYYAGAMHFSENAYALFWTLICAYQNAAAQLKGVILSRKVSALKIESTFNSTLYTRMTRFSNDLGTLG